MGKMYLETSIIKAKREKDGLFIKKMLKHQKFLKNGIHGFTGERGGKGQRPFGQ